MKQLDNPLPFNNIDIIQNKTILKYEPSRRNEGQSKQFYQRTEKSKLTRKDKIEAVILAKQVGMSGASNKLNIATKTLENWTKLVTHLYLHLQEQQPSSTRADRPQM